MSLQDWARKTIKELDKLLCSMGMHKLYTDAGWGGEYKRCYYCTYRKVICRSCRGVTQNIYAPSCLRGTAGCEVDHSDEQDFGGKS